MVKNLLSHEWFCSADGDNCLGSFHVGCRVREIQNTYLNHWKILESLLTISITKLNAFRRILCPLPLQVLLTMVPQALMTLAQQALMTMAQQALMTLAPLLEVEPRTSTPPCWSSPCPSLLQKPTLWSWFRRTALSNWPLLHWTDFAHNPCTKYKIQILITELKVQDVKDVGQSSEKLGLIWTISLTPNLK